jgi:hypothetical protein
VLKLDHGRHPRPSPDVSGVQPPFPTSGTAHEPALFIFCNQRLQRWPETANVMCNQILHIRERWT